MYNCVILDVDGTLIDTEAAVIGSLKKLLEERGHEVPADHELRFVLGIPGRDSLPRFGMKDVEEACERWNAFMKDFAEQIRPYDGIREALRRLKNAGITTGIVTSKTRQELENDFVPFGLMDQLDYVVCADDTEKHKPCPDPLMKFLELSGADPARSVYVGDTKYDAECASAAGVDFALALWGAPAPGEVRGAAHWLDHPSDIPGLASV